MSVEYHRGRWTTRVAGPDGTRKRVPLKAETREQAEAAEAALKQTLRTAAKPAAAPRVNTLADAFDRAMRLHYKGRSSERTVEFHRKAIFASVNPETPLAAVKVELYDRVVKDQLAKGNSTTTCNRIFQTWGRVMQLAHGWHMMPALPPAMPSFKEQEGRIRVYAPEEIDAIAAEFTRLGWPQMADLTVFLVDTGFRLGEYVRRDRQCYHRARKAFEVWRTKAGDGRTLPLTARAAAAILRLVDAGPLTKDQIESRWATMRRNLGQDVDPEFVIHALRHTCCTRLIRGGMPIAQVMRWMGHRDVKTTLRYTHLIEGDIAHGAALLESTQAATHDA